MNAITTIHVAGLFLSPFSLTIFSLFNFHTLSLNMAPMCRWLVVIGWNFLNKNKDFHYTSKGSKTNNNCPALNERMFPEWLRTCIRKIFIPFLYITSKLQCSKHAIRSQFTITEPGLPRRGHQPQRWRCNLLFWLIFPEDCMKMKKNKLEGGVEGRWGALLCHPLETPVSLNNPGYYLLFTISSLAHQQYSNGQDLV